MASLGEIEDALEIYRLAGALSRVVLLHCTSAYPAPPAEINLRVIETLRRAFGCRVGFSDHSQGSAAAVAAAALGAEVIEKHFTLDRSLPGPDHAASCIPEEFAELVGAIRAAEACLGSGIKRVQPSEEQMRRISRKSLIAVRDVAAGDLLVESMIGSRRPGTGMSPMGAHLVLGRAAVRDIKEGEILAPEMFKAAE